MKWKEFSERNYMSMQVILKDLISREMESESWNSLKKNKKENRILFDIHKKIEEKHTELLSVMQCSNVFVKISFLSLK